MPLRKWLPSLCRLRNASVDPGVDRFLQPADPTSTDANRSRKSSILDRPPQACPAFGRLCHDHLGRDQTLADGRYFGTFRGNLSRHIETSHGVAAILIAALEVPDCFS